MKETTKIYRRKTVRNRLDTLNNKMTVLMFAMALFIIIRLGDFILFLLQK